MLEVPDSVEAQFTAAGWQPANVAPKATKTLSALQRATTIISEVGGLHVEAAGAGRETAASDVRFYRQIRPEVTVAVRPWSRSLGELVGVANAHRDHIILFVDSDGALYAFTDPDEQLYSIGRTFGEAMERLLLGLSYGPPIPRDA
jgi:hypothetical protein